MRNQLLLTGKSLDGDHKKNRISRTVSIPQNGAGDRRPRSIAWGSSNTGDSATECDPFRGHQCGTFDGEMRRQEADISGLETHWPAPLLSTSKVKTTLLVIISDLDRWIALPC